MIPSHVQFKGLGIQRRVFSPNTAGGCQGFGGVIGHGGDDIGTGKQGAQAVELRNGQHHVALAAEFFQLGIDKAAQVTGK